MQKLEQTFYRLIEQFSFLHQTGQSLSMLPAADANGETPPLHLQNRAGCWGIQGWLWCCFTQHLDKRHSMTQQFNSTDILLLSRPSHINTQTRSQLSHGVHFLSSLLNSANLKSFWSSPSAHFSPPHPSTGLAKPTQQITNWCLAWETVLCLPLAAWVKSLLCAQLGYYNHRCWSQYRSHEPGDAVCLSLSRRSRKKRASCEEEKLTQVS